MTNALTAFGIAVGGTSLIYLLATRLQGGGNRRGRSRNGAGSDGGYYAGDDSGSLFGLSGHHHSSCDHAASGHCAGSDSTGSSGESDGCASGGGDSGGGDGGEGGDGGGGGSD